MPLRPSFTGTQSACRGRTEGHQPVPARTGSWDVPDERLSRIASLCQRMEKVRTLRNLTRGASAAMCQFPTHSGVTANRVAFHKGAHVGAVEAIWSRRCSSEKMSCVTVLQREQVVAHE